MLCEHIVSQCSVLHNCVFTEQAAEEVGGYGKRLAFALLSFLAAQYGWQTVPCCAAYASGPNPDDDVVDGDDR